MQYFSSKITENSLRCTSAPKKKTLRDLGQDLEEYLARVQLGLQLFLSAFPDIPEHKHIGLALIIYVRIQHNVILLQPLYETLIVWAQD